MANRTSAVSGVATTPAPSGAHPIQFSVIPGAGVAGTAATVEIQASGTGVFEDALDDSGAALTIDLTAIGSGSAYTRRIGGNVSAVRVTSDDNSDAFDLVVDVSGS